MREDTTEKRAGQSAAESPSAGTDRQKGSDVLPDIKSMYLEELRSMVRE